MEPLAHHRRYVQRHASIGMQQTWRELMKHTIEDTYKDTQA